MSANRPRRVRGVSMSGVRRAERYERTGNLRRALPSWIRPAAIHTSDQDRRSVLATEGSVHHEQ
jgi:hypothetical protein